MSTLVSVGNAQQPFHRLLDAIVALAPELPQPVFVQHGHTPFSSPAMETVDFVGMEDFKERLAEVDLLILHGGVGTVLQALDLGRTPIVMPRQRRFAEVVDDHQIEFAQAMAERSLVVVANNADELRSAITSLRKRSTAHVTGRDEPRLVGLIRDALRQHGERLAK